MPRKKVIVVMPAYNAARTLEKTYKDIPPGTVDEVILVDDVFTTGATLRLCAQCLKNGDPQKILALTAARTL